jgi:hypothetical protein
MDGQLLIEWHRYGDLEAPQGDAVLVLRQQAREEEEEEETERGEDKVTEGGLRKRVRGSGERVPSLVTLCGAAAKQRVLAAAGNGDYEPAVEVLSLPCQLPSLEPAVEVRPCPPSP